eukprot:scaffold78685_cov63-Phaeocystis_antarctica.AAC.2
MMGASRAAPSSPRMVTDRLSFTGWAACSIVSTDVLFATICSCCNDSAEPAPSANVTMHVAGEGALAKAPWRPILPRIHMK